MDKWLNLLDSFINVATSSRGGYLASITNVLLPLGLNWSKDEIKDNLLKDTGHDMALLLANSIPQIIIESRPANHEQQENDIRMLSSFMNQFDVNIGMYFGKRVEIYYKESTNKRAFKLFEMGLTANDPKWEQFYTLFERSTFNPQRICSYYSDRIRVIQDEILIEQQVEELTSERGHEIIKNTITEFLQQQDIPSGLIDAILSKLDITITRNDKISTTCTPLQQDITKLLPYNIINHNISKYKRGFSVDGEGCYRSWRDLALAIAKKLIKRNPNLTFRELQYLFKFRKTLYIASFSEIKEKRNNSTSKSQQSRWFDDQPFISSDGVKYAFSNQWGSYDEPDIKHLTDIRIMIGIGMAHGLEITQIDQTDNF